MKIILISIILILIYYALFRKSCGCEGFEDNSKSKRKQIFDQIKNIAKKVSSKKESGKKESSKKKENNFKSFVSSLLNSEQSTTESASCPNNSKNLFKTKAEAKSEAKLMGQLIINKLLAERNKSRAEMKIASDKLFGKVQMEIPDSSYDDKFVVNSNLGNLGTVLPVVNNTDKQGKIHLAELPKCKVPMKTNLMSNYNNIINSGVEIYQDILKPESNKTFIHNVRHNLMQVAWVKSSLQWHGENIQLEIRFTNVNPDNGQRVHIVFPIKLVDTFKKIEKFTDTYYNLNLNEFQQKASNKIGDVKNGVMFPVLEDKLNTFAKDVTTKHINKIDKKLKDLTNIHNKIKSNLLSKKAHLKIRKPFFGIKGETILSERVALAEIRMLQANAESVKTIINLEKQQNDIIKKTNTLILDKLNVIKNPIQENAMIKELTKNSKSIVNQMKNGMNSTLVDIKTFKKNKTFNKQNLFHSEIKIKSALKDINVSKIDVKTIPKSVDLNDFKKKLESTNFNFVTKEIKNVKYSYADIDCLLNLNSLIVDTSVIPDYMCCKPTIGQLITMDFSQIEKKIIAQDFFYYTHGNDGSLIFITQPHPFEKKIGNVILENLISDTKSISK